MDKEIKKQEKSLIKKQEIVEAALECFFEKGYEETSIRMIQNKVNSPVGLFYYYFKSKDAVFEEAIKLFFDKYELEMQKIIENKKGQELGMLKEYLEYINNATQDFRQQYLLKLHWSILGAIREYTIKVMRKYVLEILNIYKQSNIIDIKQDEIEIIANLIAFSVGGSILYQNKDTYDLQIKYIYESVAKLLHVKEF